MIGTTELVEKIKKYFPEINKSQLEKVIEKFLAEIKQGLINGETISFKRKGYFELSRGRVEPKESKRCEKHERAVENYKRTNKGKGIAAYAKSDIWRKLLNEAKGCNNCKVKKQKVEKMAKLTDRVVFRPSSSFLKTSKTKKR